MRNIRQPITRILLNSVTDKIIGLYGDEVMGRRMLKFKQLGITIPGDTHTATTNPLAASGTLNADLEVSKSTSDDGLLKGWLVELNPMAPAEITHWGYGLVIRPKVKMPGVRNNRHDAHQVTYGGSIAAITTTSGYVDDTYVLEAEDDIIEQIYLDDGMHNNNTDPISKMSGAVCEAKRAYRINIDAGDAADITITDDDGVATTVTLNTASIASAHAINNNATLQLYVQAFAVSTTQIMVVSRNSGTLFTVADGAGTGTLEVVNRYIMLVAKEQQVQFDVELPKDMGTLEGFSYYSISGTTTAGTTTVSVDGTDTAALNDHDTSATYVANLNTGFSNASLTNIYASYDTYVDEAIVYSNASNKSIKFTFSAASTSELEDKISYFAKYPSLTADDVHRIFSHYNKGGKLSAFLYADNAIQGEDYTLYTLTFKGTRVSGLHGASYDALHTREVHLYVLSSAIDDDIYDANVPNDQYSFIDEVTTGKTLDTNLEDLLQIWSGIVPSSW
jgi:hypothetical protein